MYRKIVIILMSLFFHIYCGLEITFGSFLTAFGKKSSLKIPKRRGAILSSLFWATFTFFRLFAIFYIDYVGPQNNLLIEILIVLLSNVFLAPFGDQIEWALWTGSALMGFGLSTIWACNFGYIEEYFPVTSKITASFITSACLGEFVVPVIMSNFIDIYPKVFLYLTLGCSLMLALLLVTIVVFCRFKLSKHHEVTVSKSDNRNGQE